MRLPFRHKKELTPYQVLERTETMKAIRGIGLAFISSILVIAIELGLHQFATLSHPFVFSLFGVVLSSWYGGIRAGLVATGIILLIDGYLFLPSYQQAGNLLQLLMFAGVGFATAYTFEKIKNTDEIKFYKKGEKEHALVLTKLQEETQRAQEAVKARDEFLSIASHELKTPLTSMLLHIQSILHSVRNVSLAQFSVDHLMKMLESAEVQSKRASKMVNDLLNVSLITTGRMDLEKEQVNLSEMVTQMLVHFEERIKRDNYKLTTNIQEDVTGTWDRIRIEQVITNLIGNALKYGNHKPIYILVRKLGNTAEFMIQDRGIGIPEEVQKRIFDRFDRGVNNGNNAIKGLGIGLYITSQIVKAHQGKIVVRSKEAKGTTFTISLPAK